MIEGYLIDVSSKMLPMNTPVRNSFWHDCCVKDGGKCGLGRSPLRENGSFVWTYFSILITALSLVWSLPKGLPSGAANTDGNHFLSNIDKDLELSADS